MLGNLITEPARLPGRHFGTAAASWNVQRQRKALPQRCSSQRAAMAAAAPARPPLALRRASAEGRGAGGSRKIRWPGGRAIIARRLTLLSFVSPALDATSDAKPAEKRLSSRGQSTCDGRRYPPPLSQTRR